MKNRHIIECNFIFCLYKDPLLFVDYLSAGQDQIEFYTEDGCFYYSLGVKLYQAGYRTFDNISIYEYLSNKPEIQAVFDSLGGYQTVVEIESLLDVNNIETYYDELCKSNLLIRLHKAGFDAVSELDLFQEMNCEQVYSYFEYKLNSASIAQADHSVVENLSEGYESYIEDWDTGSQMGFDVAFPLLNRRLAGVHRSNLLLHLAHIGNGKTTTAILFYILPALKSGQNVCIIGNEQSVNEFRQMILSTVLFNEIGDAGMNRQKIIQGHFTPQQKQKLYQAAQWLADCPGKLQFAEMPDYSIARVKKIIRKYSSLNYSLFVFDTLKPEQESSDKAWALLSDVAKELFLLAKQLDVAVIATAQLSMESMGRKFLDLSCVGKSRAIAETATQVVMFRTMQDTEKQNLKVWKYSRSESEPEKGPVRQIKQLDTNKDYIVLFTPKNRFGDTNNAIVYQRNMDFNTYFEIGYCTISYDSLPKR